MHWQEVGLQVWEVGWWGHWQATEVFRKDLSHHGHDGCGQVLVECKTDPMEEVSPASELNPTVGLLGVCRDQEIGLPVV